MKRELRAMRKHATELLGQRGNRLPMILLGILLIFAALLPLILSITVTDVLFGAEEDGLPVLEEILFLCLTLVLTAAITAPAVTAWYQAVYGLWQRTEKGVLSPPPPADWRYSRLLTGGLLILSRPLVILLLFVGAYALGELTEFFLYLPLAACAAGLSVLWMYLTRGLFLLPHFLCLGCSVGVAVSKSRRAMRGKKRIYREYSFRFFWLCMLSLLTAGALLILYVLPLMLFTYFLLARQVTDDSIKPIKREETTNE